MKQGARHTVNWVLGIHQWVWMCTRHRHTLQHSWVCPFVVCVQGGFCMWPCPQEDKIVVGAQSTRNSGTVQHPQPLFLPYMSCHCPNPSEPPWLSQSSHNQLQHSQHLGTTLQAAPTSCYGGDQRLLLLLLLLLLLITLLLLPMLLLEVQLALREWHGGPKLGSTQQSQCGCVRTSVPRRSLGLSALLDRDTYLHIPMKTPETAACSRMTASSAQPPDSGWKAEHQAPVETH